MYNHIIAIAKENAIILRLNASNLSTAKIFLADALSYDDFCSVLYILERIETIDSKLKNGCYDRHICKFLKETDGTTQADFEEWCLSNDYKEFVECKRMKSKQQVRISGVTKIAKEILKPFEVPMDYQEVLEKYNSAISTYDKNRFEEALNGTPLYKDMFEDGNFGKLQDAISVFLQKSVYEIRRLFAISKMYEGPVKAVTDFILPHLRWNQLSMYADENYIKDVKKWDTEYYRILESEETYADEYDDENFYDSDISIYDMTYMIPGAHRI